MFLKIISVRFMDINLVKSVINGGQFDQNRTCWVKMFQNWVILCQNGATGQNLGKVVKYFFSKSFKNDFSQVYGHKFRQKCH